MLDSRIKKKWISEEKEWGLVAIEVIPAGTTVIVDEGPHLTADEFFALTQEEQDMGYQVEDYEFIVSPNLSDPSDEYFQNHSHDPNTRHEGNGVHVASRLIEAKEEVTCHYAIFQSNDFGPYVIRPCLCGAKNCPGEFTGESWEDSEVQALLGNQFFPHLRRRIAAKKASQKEAE